MSKEQMQSVSGGLKFACDGFTASAAVMMSSLGLLAMAAGPVGWPAALIAGGAGLYLGTQCGR